MALLEKLCIIIVIIIIIIIIIIIDVMCHKLYVA